MTPTHGSDNPLLETASHRERTASRWWLPALAFGGVLLVVLCVGGFAFLYGSKRVTILKPDAKPFEGELECDGSTHWFSTASTPLHEPDAASILIWGESGACVVSLRGPVIISQSFSYRRAQTTMYCLPDWDKGTIDCDEDD